MSRLILKIGQAGWNHSIMVMVTKWHPIKAWKEERVACISDGVLHNNWQYNEWTKKSDQLGA